MTHREIRTEPDGTRVYADGHRYRPKAPQERVNGVRKPDHPDAVRFHGDWFLPLPVLPEEARTMPATRPDDQTLEHRPWCRCEVCRRPEARVLWRRATRRRRAAAPGS